MTTVLEIFQQAYATSRLNEAGRIADETGELLTLVNELLRGYMAAGARANRNMFGQRVSVDFDAMEAGWPRPDTAEMIMRLEAGVDVLDGNGDAIAAGTEVVVIPFDQRHIEPGKPAVYEFGGVFWPAGRATDPASGHLTLFCATAPAALATINDTLPDVWPEAAGDPLLKWEIAIYLATKDGERDNEVAAFEIQRKRSESAFIAFCESATTMEVRAYGHGGRFNSPKVSPR